MSLIMHKQIDIVCALSLRETYVKTHQKKTQFYESTMQKLNLRHLVINIL